MDHNPLEELPIDIDNLINLKVLEVSHTKLKRLSPNIVKLNNIESINFDSIIEDNLLLCQKRWIFNIMNKQKEDKE